MDKILRDRRLYQFFERIDLDSAQAVRSGGCVYCGGCLQQADYERKSRVDSAIGKCTTLRHDSFRRNGASGRKGACSGWIRYMSYGTSISAKG